MSKFHIKRDGTPGACHATKNCPLGGEDSHYSTMEEAQTAAQKKLERQFGVDGNNAKTTVDFSKPLRIEQIKNYKVNKDYYVSDDLDYVFENGTMECLQNNMENIDKLKEGEEYRVYSEVGADEEVLSKLSSDDYSRLDDSFAGIPSPTVVFVVNSKYSNLISDEYRDHPNATFSK